MNTIKTNNAGKSKNFLPAGPLDAYQMEKILSLISYSSAMTGFSAAAFVLAIRHFLLILFLGKNNTVTDIGRPYIPLIFLAGILSFLISIPLNTKREHCLEQPLKAYPRAASYFSQSTSASCWKIILSAILCVAGFLLSACTPAFLPPASLYLFLVIYIAATAIGAFLFAFFLQKQRICKNITVELVTDRENKDCFNHSAERRRGIFKWVFYWFVVLAAYFAISIVFQNMVMYSFYLVLAAANCILRLAINNPLRRFSSIRSKRITVRLWNIFSVLALFFLYLYIIESGSEYNNNYLESLDYHVFEHHSSFSYDHGTGVYTISSTNEEFRILQLTDIHICSSITTIRTDRKAFNACYELIQKAQPDLIIITGDMVYPIPTQTFNKDNLIPIYQLCMFMNHIGIPWAMVYGNHDTETVATYNAKELSGIYNYFIQQPGCPMLYADKQPDIYGRYNQYLRIENPDGSLNHIIFLVDSNDYIKDSAKVDDYDSVHEDQIQWYADTLDQLSAQEGRIVPSFVFMHIPFPAFADAQAALKNGDPDAIYLFGENGEEVCCPDQDSGFFDVILQKQSTEAVFVGHDHLNNMGVRYKGVDLVYSKSIDYYAYPGIAKKTKQRGATLITLSFEGNYKITQLDYTK